MYFCSKWYRKSVIMKILPLSTRKESAIPQLLIEELRQNNVNILIGSGISIPLGFPSWGQLVEQLYESLAKGEYQPDSKTKGWLKENFKSYPDWTAELLKNLPGNFYVNSLSKIFNRLPRNPLSIVHALIALLPFKSYITTNYETTIEEYLSEFLYNPPVIYSHMDIINNNMILNNEIPVFKIHGCIKKKIDDLVLASSDYYNLLHNQQYVRFIDNLFSQNIIFSVGFSLKDRDFRYFAEERYNLYRSKCAPMYAIVEENETCNLEIEVYKNNYNIHIIPISKKNEFEELKSLLLSLYCLVYQIDSTQFGPQIADLIINRLHQTGKFQDILCVPDTDEIKRARKLLSIFKEPIDIEIFTTICTDAEIELSPAHYRAISSIAGNKIFCKYCEEETDEDVDHISKWLANYFEVIPLGKTSRYLSIYYKKIFKEFSETIFYLLSKKTGWDNLIGDDEHSEKKLERFNEFFRQEGKWKEWLILIDKVENFLDESCSQFINLMKTKVWVYFWTRRYVEAKRLIEKYPLIDEKKGQYSYTIRLMYMKNSYLKKLVTDLSSELSLDYFNRSLLGRSYARLSLKEKTKKKKKELLLKAKENLLMALKGAKRSTDMVEISVQSWYLAVVCSELGEMSNAYHYLAEVKRMDESIMNRIPGIAWLKLAEYRLSLKNENISQNEILDYKNTAINYMDELGVADSEYYVDKEYFY